MARHLADHRTPSQGSRLARFIAIDRAKGKDLWLSLAKRPRAVRTTRGLAEFLRIARGRHV